MKKNIYSRIVELADQTAAGEQRYWINDSGPRLFGKIQYKGTGIPSPEVEFVGLVDEEDGGMIAFGKAEAMEQLAADLNKLWMIEELMHA